MEPDLLNDPGMRRKELVEKLLAQYEQLMQTKHGQAALNRASQKGTALFGGRRSKNSVDLPLGARPQLTFPSNIAPDLQNRLGVMNQARFGGPQTSSAYGVPAGDTSPAARSQLASAMGAGQFDPGAPRHLASIQRPADQGPIVPGSGPGPAPYTPEARPGQSFDASGQPQATFPQANPLLNALIARGMPQGQALQMSAAQRAAALRGPSLQGVRRLAGGGGRQSFNFNPYMN